MHKSLSILILAALLTVTANAQMQPQPQQMEDLPDVEHLPDRKRPSIFHNPVRETPAEQLKYAQELQAAGRLRKAKRQYLALVHKWHSVVEAPIAQEAYARILEQQRDYMEAFDEYQYLIDHFSGRFAYADVVSRQFAIAQHILSDAGKKWTRSTQRALPLLKNVVRNAPNGPRAAECEFLIGWIHESHKDYYEAVVAYEALVFRYPDSPQAPVAYFRHGYCLYELAKRSSRDEAAVRSAISALERFVMKYRGDANEEQARAYSNELKDMLANTYYKRATFYDKHSHRPQAAIIAYRDFLRNFPSSTRAPEVSARITELQKEASAADEK